jgi:predicted alpha/beta hydrolase family esterase
MVVIVYGYEGSGPGHWQRWLEGELRARGTRVVFPELPAPAAPVRDTWVAELAAVVAVADAQPLTFVCHSLGCWALDHLLSAYRPATIHAALLVAPPSPYLLFEPVQSFFPPPRDATAWRPLAARSLVVGSDNDDFTSDDEFRQIAATLGMRCEIFSAAGHVNVASGYGPWPFALEWTLAAEQTETVG